MSTSEHVDRALEILQEQRRTVGSSYICGGELHVEIDGQLRSMSEIYEMVEQPEETCIFNANGKEYKVLIWFPRGGPTFEVYEDGKRVRERRPIPLDAVGWLEYALQICREMGGTSFRRL